MVAFEPTDQETRDIGAHAPHPRKVAVIGAGNLGATFAYSLVLSGPAGEVVLIDVDHRRAEGEAMGISHAVPLSNPAPSTHGIDDLYFSLPAVIGRWGVERSLHLASDEPETLALDSSAGVLHAVLDESELAD